MSYGTPYQYWIKEENYVEPAAGTGRRGSEVRAGERKRKVNAHSPP